jgi:lipoprotein-anchoring transpeptidase ErfK/SrfK
MTPIRLLSSNVMARVAALLVLAAPTTASAQGLIDFLWGGSSDWGGGRQNVSFSPRYTPGQIIVSFGDRRLYHITGRGRATSYPIAVPREQSRWQGTTRVTMKRENPSWRPTGEMLRENPRLPRWVPGGHPMNPLGVRALYLGSSTYRIHGTDAPWTIGKAVSKGCIRMYNEDVLDLYPRIRVGTRVIVTWQRFNTSTMASTYYNDTPSFQPTYQKRARPAKPKRRVLRNLPRTPRKPVTSPAVASEKVKPAATKTAAVEPSKHAKKDTKPAAKASTSKIAEDAMKAAASAKKAAEDARKAADRAIKAAAEAKKKAAAAKATGDTQETNPAKSAAL